MSNAMNPTYVMRQLDGAAPLDVCKKLSVVTASLFRNFTAAVDSDTAAKLFTTLQQHANRISADADAGKAPSDKVLLDYRAVAADLANKISAGPIAQRKPKILKLQTELTNELLDLERIVDTVTVEKAPTPPAPRTYVGDMLGGKKDGVDVRAALPGLTETLRTRYAHAIAMSKPGKDIANELQLHANRLGAEAGRGEYLPASLKAFAAAASALDAAMQATQPPVYDTQGAYVTQRDALHHELSALGQAAQALPQPAPLPVQDVSTLSAITAPPAMTPSTNRPAAKLVQKSGKE